MTPQWTIERKRDGFELSEGELREFVEGITDGTVSDAQTAAFAMAVFIRGMTDLETAALTDAMMHSGQVLDLSQCSRPTVDKHSTGGIGDKISIPLAPLCAACGLAVPMVAGRGLGLTGGTIDKLESIQGFRTDLPLTEFRRLVSNAPFCAIIAQTPELAPADGRLYAIRDTTGSVQSIPLITASILSKKLAEGAESIVFDVKYGRGAFMPTLERGRELGTSLRRIAEKLGRKVDIRLTPMDVPHGRAVGNAPEVREAIEVLKGGGPADVRELTLDLARRMLRLAGMGEIEPERFLDDGRAYETFERLCRAQGGAWPINLPEARFVSPLLAEASGWVEEVDAAAIGRGVLLLGAGRRKPGDSVDLSAGISGLVRPGERVEKGEALLMVETACEARFREAEGYLRGAFKVVPER